MPMIKIAANNNKDNSWMIMVDYVIKHHYTKGQLTNFNMEQIKMKNENGQKKFSSESQSLKIDNGSSVLLKLWNSLTKFQGIRITQKNL